MKHRKKLIEVALPLPEINDASAYDMMPGIGAHPKGIHVWWGRKALPACRAFLFASVVDDPSSHPERFPTEEAQERERERLFGIIRKMMHPRLHEHPEVYAEARAEMLKHCDGKLPPLLDPFAGGGSIPLEAARLGMEAYAGDLNPVAVLLNKCYLELVPRWTDWPPVNPEATFLGARASRPQTIPGARASRPQTILRPRPSRPHKQWHSRGYLPHLDQPGLVQYITFRLYDSVPAHVVESWRNELQCTSSLPATDSRMVELRRRIAEFEDAGHGACYLRDERIATLVQDALLQFDGERYRLIEWVIMPNHVHVLIEVLPGNRLSDVVHSWKSFTAKEANRILGRSGEFWMPDYFDRFIRDEKHLAAVREYIRNNPVKAGLVEKPEDWKWSSACEDAGRRPALPGSLPGWRGSAGLAADVRYYGRVVLERARERIGHLYPPVKVTAEMAAEHPHLKPYVGKELPVIAWIWARTVPSPNPAARGAHVPLMSTFWLSSKKGSEAWLEPDVEWPGSAGVPPANNPGNAGVSPANNPGNAGVSPANNAWNAGVPPAQEGGQDGRAPRWRFRVRTGPPPDREAVRAGTKRGHSGFKCLLTGDPIPFAYAREMSKQGSMDTRLVAIVVDTGRGRLFVPATLDQERAAKSANPSAFPSEEMPSKALGFVVPNYGIKYWYQLFTPRQLTAMVTLSDLIREVREDVRRDAMSAGLPGNAGVSPANNPGNAGVSPAQEGGQDGRDPRDQDGRYPRSQDGRALSADAYAATVTTFLALALDRCANHNNALCRWRVQQQPTVMDLFARQAIPMSWDFAEANTVSEGRASWQECVEHTAASLETVASRQEGHALLIDAAGSAGVSGTAGVPPANNLGNAGVSPANNLGNAGVSPAQEGGQDGRDTRDQDGRDPRNQDGRAPRIQDGRYPRFLVSTDPPYYDNIGYADLSDFFYVWLRRTIGDLYPDLFGTILVPKEPELVAAPERFDGDRRKAKEHFEQGFRRAFAALREKMDPRFPLTLYYAFKQDDESSGADEEAGSAGVPPANNVGTAGVPPANYPGSAGVPPANYLGTAGVSPAQEGDQDGRDPRSQDGRDPRSQDGRDPRSQDGRDPRKGRKGAQDARAPVDRTTGWETMLTALVETGFQITATWPVRASYQWRMRAMGSNALASYIVLACRPREDVSPGTRASSPHRAGETPALQTDRRSFVAELKRELPVALRRLQQGNIAPVDFAQAAIGPGMAIYSKYSRILEASGQPMSVRTALALINQTLTEVLSEQEDEFDADTRWAIAWYEQHGFEEGDFGDAELLSKAKVTSVEGLHQAGIVRRGGGKVRLLRPEELLDEWDPVQDRRFTVWEATHHLVKIYWCQQKGDRVTADLLRRLGSHADYARDLAYRLFSIAEKKGRSAEAQAYNALVLGWSELTKLAQEQASHEQPELFSKEN
jgi:adenine-specific DNA methylase/REP element-mobilizing transposase RayT